MPVPAPLPAVVDAVPVQPVPIEPVPEVTPPAAETVAAPPAPLPAKPAPAPASQDFQFGYKEHPAQMALRHWLQASGEMTALTTVGHVAKLAGLRAAVFMDDTQTHNAGELGSTDQAFFQKRFDSLKMMLENMGQAVQGSFTMRQENVVTTFFLEDTICLAVLQNDPALADDLRDKLTLVTRELAALCK
jgi:hypothetical protein